LGKPYEQDIASFPTTLDWARQANVEPLVSAVAATGSFPLYAVGSGGAYSTAVLAAQLHQVFTGRMARPLTPLAATEAAVRSASVMLVSASGSNVRVTLLGFAAQPGPESGRKSHSFGCPNWS